MSDEKPRSPIRRLWNKHGGGYYALVAVATFLYLETVDVVSGVAAADSVQSFVMGELVTFFIESFINTMWASVWPLYWFTEYGWTAILVLGAGYIAWTVALAAALDRREKAYRKELGL